MEASRSSVDTAIYRDILPGEMVREVLDEAKGLVVRDVARTIGELVDIIWAGEL